MGVVGLRKQQQVVRDCELALQPHLLLFLLHEYLLLLLEALVDAVVVASVILG